MERGLGHTTNEAEASCSEAKARFSGLEAKTLTT